MRNWITHTLILLLFLAVHCFSQGIKGADARRHTFSITNSELRIKNEKGRGVRGGDWDSVALVLVVGKVPYNQADPEVVAAMEFVRGLEGYKVDYQSFSEIKKRTKVLKEASVVWFHRADTSDFNGAERDEKVIRFLQDYMKEGGSLLLSLDGFRYLNLLGAERAIPAVRSKPSVDEGYGRKLGFHGYRQHPLFSGLNGGAYIYKPTRDLTVRINGFFGDTVPEQGKVVAIDWDYIFFREDSKLITEYDVGPGKILAIGAYTLFGVPNDHRSHLEAFTKNVLDYLTGKLTDERAYYWTTSPPAVVPCLPKEQNRDHLFASIPAAKPWELPPGRLAFPFHPATSNYCEAAGERILIMGQEKGGIEEIWAHPFMALRDYSIGIRQEASGTSFVPVNSISEIEIRSDGFVRQYLTEGGILREVVVADPVRPCGVVHYEWDGPQPIILMIRFKSNLRLMWPYPATCTGSLCFGWDEDYRAFTIHDQSGDLVVLVGGNKTPEAYSIEPGEGYVIDAGATYSLASGEALDIVIAAGQEGDPETLGQFDQTIRDPRSVFSGARQHVEKLFTDRLMVTSPDSSFNAGYQWALLGTDRFFVTTPGMGSALVAGYGTTRRGWDGGQEVSGRPGYAWYFGRDGQWSGFALLDYGDFEKVKQNLEFYLKYQDLTGKILHEATTSGVIHYDASDATPLFIVLAGKYFRHSGDTAFLRKNWAGIKKAVDFCFSTDTDGDHLIENTNVGHGWVEGGQLYGSHSSLYLTGCWAAALEAAALMAEMMEDPASDLYRQELGTVKGLIEQRFWDPKGLFYAYGLNRNGAQRTDPTILPAVPAYFGVTDRFRIRFLLDQYAANAFSTNWGTRIIREDSPLFKPTGYHYGSVWPLFTGWTALAEYRYGNYLQGFTHIMNNLNVSRNWGLGFVEEVLNGAEYQPSGVCPHQCWSETMVVQPVIEGMLGLEVFSNRNTLRLFPRLPANWDSLLVEHIRIGNQQLSMRFLRDSVSMHWEFSTDKAPAITLEFLPVLPPGTRVQRIVVNGVDYSFATFTTSRDISVFLTVSVSVSGPVTIEITYQDGIAALPLVPSPVPGDRAEGMRILDAQLKGRTYSVNLEGLAGTSDTLSVWSYLPLESITNGTGIDRKDRITKILVEFEKTDEKYTRKQLMMIPLEQQ